MGFIPKDARWYLADVILEHIVEDDPRNVVHINMHLIEAESPEQAHEKAVTLGSHSEYEFANTDGKQVRVVFRGLRDLNVIHDTLEDGAELIYQEKVGVAEEQLRGWITSKEQLGVFAPIEPNSTGPNYMPSPSWRCWKPRDSVARMSEAAADQTHLLPRRGKTRASQGLTTPSANFFSTSIPRFNVSSSTA